MKKVLYLAASLAVLAACSKNEISPLSGNVRNIALSVAVEEDASTKAVFDGAGRMVFENYDKFAGAIAKEDSPATAIKVATQASAAANSYSTDFTIADPEAETPVFDGNIYSVVSADWADTYRFYGIFPKSAVYSAESNLSNWAVKLSSEQTPTLSQWDPKYTVMQMQPASISTSESTYDEKWDEYSATVNGNTVKFAHLFGYGRIDFAGVPEQYADYLVKSVTIKAVGENKTIAGNVRLDITKDIDEIELKPYSSSSMSDAIVLKSDASVKVSDFVAWFVALPGDYDVEITVSTAKADLVFERSGLHIRRSAIAAPTVNFKEADTVVSHNVVLADGESWSEEKYMLGTSQNCITSTYPVRAWGPEGKKMNFYLYYPDQINNNYGSNLGSWGGPYKQQMAYQNLNGGKAVLASEASFYGVKLVKVNLGIYTANVTGKFTVRLVEAKDTTVLGTVDVTGKSENYDGKDYFFDNPTGASGCLEICASDFSDSNSRPYVGAMYLNPAPEIVIAAEDFKTSSAAANFEFSYSVYASELEPSVSTSDSWISASLEDGLLKVSVAENTGAKRKGTVTLTLATEPVAEASFVITQTSPTAQDCVLKLTAQDIYDAASLVNPTIGTADAPAASSFVHTFKAKGVNDPSFEYDVEMEFTAFNWQNTTASAIVVGKGDIKCTEALGNIQKIVVSANQRQYNSNYYELSVRLSKDGVTYDYPNTMDYSYTGSKPNYVSTINVVDEGVQYFTMKTAWGTLSLYGFEVYFECE